MILNAMHLTRTPSTRKPVVAVVLVVMSLAACGPPPAQDRAPRYTAHTSKPFEEVLADLEFAIGEHNFRLTGHNTIGAAVAERTATAFPPATVLHFCNLEYAQQLLEVDPQYLLHMPCRIALYEQAGRVTVEARLLPDDGPAPLLSRRINEILKTIVSDAAN
jgi:uncharacterized protein (DUF302 family)